MSDLRDWARQRAIRLGIVKPTDEEKAELAAEQEAQQPDPQSMFLMAEAKKAEANTGLAIANTEKSKAETVKTLADIDVNRQKAAIETARALNELTQAPQQPQM